MNIQRTVCLVTVTLIFNACSKDETESTNASQTNVVSSDQSNPLTAPVDYLGAVNKGGKFANKRLELAQVNKAMQEFKILEGRLPKDLKELVDAGFLAKEPQAPYGMKVHYDPTTGNVSILPMQK